MPAPLTHAKQRFSIYTMMLILSCIAIVTAITIVGMELNRYGKTGWWDVREAGTAPK